MPDEIGYQTAKLLSWGQLAEETHETNADLMWPASIDVFDKMRREDSQVKSVLSAVTLPIRRTSWMLDPAGVRDEVTNLVAEDLGLPVKGRPQVARVRTRGRFSWDEHLRLALLELPFGHSCFEQVYRVDGATNRLRKLAWRPPRTISKIDVANDGGLVAIEQHGVAGKSPVRIPVDRLVMYVNDREGGNWLGTSLLRPAYKNWLLKDRVLRAQGLTIERNGLGIPTYTSPELPAGISDEERDRRIAEERAAGLKMTKALRAGESAGVSLAHGAQLALTAVSGKLPDTSGPIQEHNEAIAKAVLAHFLNLGSETGSWALGSTFADFFTGSLNAVAGHIAEVTQQHVVEDLVDLNWGPEEPAPRIVPAVIGEEQPATAEAIKQLIECRALVPDDELEAYLRARYRLPVKSTATSRALPGADTQEGS